MTISLLPAEARLVLATAGGPRTDRTIDALLELPLDWSFVTLLSEVERASPILWRRVSGRPGAMAIPPDVAEPLQRLAMVSEFKMLHLQQRMEETLDAIDSAGVEVMLLKGSALACAVYRSFTMRPMADIDLLVAPGQEILTRDIAMANGWAWSETTHGEAFYEAHHHLRPLYDTRGIRVGLELHRGLFPDPNPFGLAAPVIWAGRRPVSFGQRTVWVPSVQHMLLHACLHFVWSHAAREGAWRAFRDIGALAESGTIDWDEFVMNARDHRAGTICYWTLRLAARAAEVAIPDEVLTTLRPSRSEYVLQRLERHFVRHMLPALEPCPSVRLERAMWRLGVQPRRSGHGRMLPWHHVEPFVAAAEPPARATGRAQVTQQIDRLRRLTRYARVVF